ncbi:hypothetical protein ACFLRC_00820, partial [Candidatus Altiarchaeota archaeon]
MEGEDNSDKAEELVKAVRGVVKAPVAIDSISRNELQAGVDAGVDLLLSVSEETLDLANGLEVP